MTRCSTSRGVSSMLPRVEILFRVGYNSTIMYNVGVDWPTRTRSLGVEDGRTSTRKYRARQKKRKRHEIDIEMALPVALQVRLLCQILRPTWLSKKGRYK